ncbi:MAG: hypothetical protein ACRC91_03160 [Aeromonas sp.]
MIPTARMSNETTQGINWTSIASPHVTHPDCLSQRPVTHASLFQEKIKMKKNVLALSVVAALSSLALAGCGGGGDGASSDNGNNGGNGGNATKPTLTATFIDSAVGAVVLN